MAVQKVEFVGFRTPRLQETVALFRDVLGLTAVRETKDLVGFRLADGAILELYSPADTFHAFFETGPVVGFRVENFEEARAAMLCAGVPFLGEPQHAEGIGWQHFRTPDGTILEIIGPAAPPEPAGSGEEE